MPSAISAAKIASRTPRRETRRPRVRYRVRGYARSSAAMQEAACPAVSFSRTMARPSPPCMMRTAGNVAVPDAHRTVATELVDMSKKGDVGADAFSQTVWPVRHLLDAGRHRHQGEDDRGWRADFLRRTGPEGSAAARLRSCTTGPCPAFCRLAAMPCPHAGPDEPEAHLPVDRKSAVDLGRQGSDGQKAHPLTLR